MKSIVIYNPISGHGHLDSWSAIFTKVLLESGWTVLVITPDPRGLISILREHSCLSLNHLKVIPATKEDAFASLSKNSKKVSLARLWRKINIAGLAHVFSAEKLANGGPRKFHEKLLAASYLLLHFCRYFLFPLAKVKLKTKEMDKDAPVLVLRDIEQEIDGQKFEANVVFHMYLDGLNLQTSHLSGRMQFLKRKWAGICFAPEGEDNIHFDRYRNLQGVAFLDESVANNVAKYLPEGRIQYLPDIANLKIPQELPGIADLIKRSANGRKIVFLGGIIGLRKNLSLWLELINRADSKKWYFVQAGEIDFKGLSAKDFLSVYQKLLFTPNNLMLMPEYISDEGVFNSIISVSDIVFAVYRNFKNSSNMITKASFFHKPILVSDRYLMGRRVQSYGIGLAVPEDDIQGILFGLDKLASENISSANFDNYNQDFNLDNFGSRFLKFMDDLNEL